MSNDGQDDQNVNNEQAQTSLNATTSDNQEQKEKTNDNNDSLTPEAVTSPSNANISGEQNTAQVTNASNEVQKPEVTTNDLVRNKETSVNNEQRQLQSNTNIGENQNKVSLNNQEVESELDKLLSRIDKIEPMKKLEDAQVKNVLDSIKAQMASATNNYAELGRLAGALAALAASTNNPELLATIKSMLNAVESKEETAKEVIRNDTTAENLEVQEHQDPEMVRKHLEHEERKTRIDNNWAEYEKIEKESRERLIANNRFLDQIYNDPNSLTEEQKRLARGQYHSTEEKENVEKKARQDIDFAKRAHELHRDLNHAIVYEQEQLNILAPKIEVEQTRAGNDELLEKKQQYEKNISLYQKRLEQHINPAIAELDLEREKLLKVVDTHPDLVKDRIRIHFEGNMDRYEEMKILKGEPKALEEMEQLIKKAGLENELNTKRRDKIDLPQSKETTSSQVALSSISSNNKRHNIFEETLNIRNEYKLVAVPKEVIRNIQIKGIENAGWLGDAQKMTSRPVTGPTSPVQNVTIKPPVQTPNIKKFAARGADIIKK